MKEFSLKQNMTREVVQFNIIKHVFRLLAIKNAKKVHGRLLECLLPGKY